MWKWIVNHQAKVIGLGLIIVGYLQNNSDQLKNLMSSHAFSIFVMVLGGVVACLDFLKPGDSSKPPSAPPYASLLVLAVAVPMLWSCALLANPTFDAVLQAVIDVVIGQVLNKNPTAATEIAQDATALAALAGGDTTTVAGFQSKADAIIAASTLPVNDKAAMEAVVAAAAGLIAQEATNIPANAQSALQLVFEDMANAANLYAQAAGKTNIILQK